MVRVRIPFGRGASRRVLAISPRDTNQAERVAVSRTAISGTRIVVFMQGRLQRHPVAGVGVRVPFHWGTGFGLCLPYLQAPSLSNQVAPWRPLKAAPAMRSIWMLVLAGSDADVRSRRRMMKAAPRGAATSHSGEHHALPARRSRATSRAFGTIKAWMGSTHFLMKRLPNVKTEIGLHILAYNLKRVIAILGVGPLMKAIKA